jgi:heavy metal sensor kinase
VIGSVRARLALWYAGVFTLIFAAFATAGYLFLRESVLARTDEFLAQTAGAVAGALVEDYAKEKSVADAVDFVMAEFRFRDVGIALFDAVSGKVIDANPAHERREVAQAVEEPDREDEEPADSILLADVKAFPAGLSRTRAAFATLRQDEGVLRLFALPVKVGHRHIVVAATRAMRRQEKTLAEAKLWVLVGVPLALVLSSLVGYALARKSLAPVVAMSEQAARIGATNLHERLAVTNPRDELGTLARAFNGLLERLDRSFEQQRRFMADASHELRTPVAVVSGEAALALTRDDRSTGELRESLHTVREEGRRMKRIVDDLFLLARADAGEQPLVHSELYLDELADEQVRALRTLAEAKGIEVARTGEDELAYRGDEMLLRRMLTNLLDNAIKYTPSEGRVSLDARRVDGRFVVTVSDTGPGVPEESRARIFERFYRADRARERRSDSDGSGAGLGLAISRWIAESHGGTLQLTESGTEGSTFTVELPAAPYFTPAASS